MSRVEPQPASTRARERIGYAAREFRRRWGVRRAPPAPASPVAVAVGMVAFGVALTLVGVFLDAFMTVEARSLPPTLRAVARAVTAFGDSAWVFALSAIMTIAPLLMRGGAGSNRARDRALALLSGRAAFIFAVSAFSGILAQILKHLVGRARPRLFDEFGAFHFVLPGYPSIYASFPSGHTITAFAGAAALGFFIPRWRPALYGAAAMIAISRVALGAHYPSDVVGGAVIGWLSAHLARRAFAARGIVFRVTREGIVARDAGRLWPALRPKNG